MRSRKRKGSSPHGKVKELAQPAEAAPSPMVLVPNKSFLHPGGQSKRKASSATDVKTTTKAQGQQGTTLTRRSSAKSAKFREIETQTSENSAGGETDKPTKRELPNSANKSLVATQSKGPTKSDDRPIFEAELVTTKKPKLRTAEKHVLRRCKKVEIEEDCFYWLLDEFAFVPRTNVTLRDMKVKLTKYLNKFDMRSYTNKQRYQMTIDVVGLAMLVPKEEQAVRQSLKDAKVLEDMHKQNLLIEDGAVGATRTLSSGFLRREYRLDKG
jgi:hypothetical protein